MRVSQLFNTLLFNIISVISCQLLLTNKQLDKNIIIIIVMFSLCDENESQKRQNNILYMFFLLFFTILISGIIHGAGNRGGGRGDKSRKIEGCEGMKTSEDCLIYSQPSYAKGFCYHCEIKSNVTTDVKVFCYEGQDVCSIHGQCGLTSSWQSNFQPSVFESLTHNFWVGYAGLFRTGSLLLSCLYYYIKRPEEYWFLYQLLFIYVINTVMFISLSLLFVNNNDDVEIMEKFCVSTMPFKWSLWSMKTIVFVILYVGYIVFILLLLCVRGVLKMLPLAYGIAFAVNESLFSFLFTTGVCTFIVMKPFVVLDRYLRGLLWPAPAGEDLDNIQLINNEAVIYNPIEDHEHPADLAREP